MYNHETNILKREDRDQPKGVAVAERTKELTESSGKLVIYSWLENYIVLLVLNEIMNYIVLCTKKYRKGEWRGEQGIRGILIFLVRLFPWASGGGARGSKRSPWILQTLIKIRTTFVTILTFCQNTITKIVKLWTICTHGCFQPPR